ncbi:MAG: BatA domain-containing protein [Verrucomicrobiales bacterium]|jgi:hypothetical protein|nr:BatA domain-containing protein [Verrucomicrobiales bacterium]
MSFLVPAMLAGLAAVAVPVAIHLLNKFRVQKTDWAAFKFLADSLRKNERRLRVEDAILLAARCLLVALLALAFAQPALRAIVSAGQDLTGPVAALVLLDNSASMAQSDGVATRLERAKTLARDWLDQREVRASAALWLVSDRVEPLVESPSADAALFRKMLDGAAVSARGSDLAQGLRAAYQTLAGISGRPREIRVYSDDQTRAWRNLDEIKKLAVENPGVHLRVVTVSAAGEPNIGVTDFRASGGVAAVKSPARYRAELANFGDAPAPAVRATLKLDDGTVLDEKAVPQIEPGATQFVDFIVNFFTPGFHTLTVEIPPDAFPADNRRTLALKVTARAKALVAEGNASADEPADRDGYFLANALVPLPRDQAARYYLELVFANAARLDPATVSDCQAVFLCNPPAPDAATASVLKNYVEAGGNLVIFPGALTDADKFNAALGDLLPAKLGAAKDADREEKFIAWQSGDFEHPVTALWNESGQGTLGAVRVSRYCPLTVRDGAGVIARLANGEPAVAERAVGKGRVVLFNSTATPEWNNLPLHPAFVPLTQRLLGWLGGGDDTRLTLRPGEPFVAAVPDGLANREFTVQPPGENVARETGGQVLADGDRYTVRYPFTEKTGAYRVYVGNDEVAVFAVQLDPAESDLRVVAPEDLAQLAAAPVAASAKQQATLTVTREFWFALLILAALLAVTESALAHWFSFGK